MKKCSGVVAFVVLTTVLVAQESRPTWNPGLPSLDLATATELQTVVDREKGQYLGHPTTVLLDDHTTLLAVYPKGHGKGAILLKRSRDGGKTWSERLPTPASWATSLETPTLFSVRKPDGSPRLLLFSGLYPIRLARSDDEGKTWSELEPIGKFGGIVAMSSLVSSGDGTLTAFFHDDGRYLRAKGESRPQGFRVYCTRSRDCGLTWSEPELVAHDPKLHLCEPGALRSPDGKTLALLLRENSRRHGSQVVFSSDEAKSWSAPRELCLALHGDRHVAKYAPDGRLVVVFRDMAAESPTKGDFVLWVGQWQDLANGTPGALRVRLLDNLNAWDCGYPGLELLPDGTFVATTYGHWQANEAPYVIAVRFQLGAIDRLLEKRDTKR